MPICPPQALYDAVAPLAVIAAVTELPFPGFLTLLFHWHIAWG